MSSRTKANFEKLLQERDKFEISEGEYYDDLSGEREANNLEVNLKLIFEGGIPSCKSGELKSADKMLNEVYKLVPRARAQSDYPLYKSYSDLHPQEARQYKNETEMTESYRPFLKKVEKSWLVYRDAWVRFGKSYAPNSGADCWDLFLTRERIWQLWNIDMELNKPIENGQPRCADPRSQLEKSLCANPELQKNPEICLKLAAGVDFKLETSDENQEIKFKGFTYVVSRSEFIPYDFKVSVKDSKFGRPDVCKLKYKNGIEIPSEDLRSCQWITNSRISPLNYDLESPEVSADAIPPGEEAGERAHKVAQVQLFGGNSKPPIISPKFMDNHGCALKYFEIWEDDPKSPPKTGFIIRSKFIKTFGDLEEYSIGGNGEPNCGYSLEVVRNQEKYFLLVTPLRKFVPSSLYQLGIDYKTKKICDFHRQFDLVEFHY